MSIINDRINSELERLRKYDPVTGNERPKKLSYAALAEDIFRLHPSTISRLKKGLYEPTNSRIDELAKIFHVRKEYLLGQDNFRTVDEFNKNENQINQITLKLRDIFSSLGYYDSLDNEDIIYKPDNLSMEDFYRLISLKRNKEIHTDHLIAKRDTDFKYIKLSAEEHKQLIDNITDYIRFTIENLFTRRHPDEIYPIKLNEILIEMAKNAERSESDNI